MKWYSTSMVEFDRDLKSDFSIGGRLQFARKHLVSLKASEFAKVLKVSASQLYNYENMRTPVSCGVALRFCRTFFIDEKWFAFGEGVIQPCVDLMGHPDYLTIDPSAPFSQVFLELESAYNELLQLPFYDRVEYLLNGCGNDTFRLKQFTEFIFEFYSANIAPWEHAELVEATMKSIRKYLEHNEKEYAFGKGCVSPGYNNGIPE